MEVAVESDQEEAHDSQIPTHENTARRLPPIVVVGRNDWEHLEEMMKMARINFTTAKTTRGGIKIFVKYPDDYNKCRVKFREVPTNCLMKRNIHGLMETTNARKMVQKL